MRNSKIVVRNYILVILLLFQFSQLYSEQPYLLSYPESKTIVQKIMYSYINYCDYIDLFRNKSTPSLEIKHDWFLCTPPDSLIFKWDTTEYSRINIGGIKISHDMTIDTINYSIQSGYSFYIFKVDYNFTEYIENKTKLTTYLQYFHTIYIALDRRTARYLILSGDEFVDPIHDIDENRDRVDSTFSQFYRFLIHEVKDTVYGPELCQIYFKCLVGLFHKICIDNNNYVKYKFLDFDLKLPETTVKKIIFESNYYNKLDCKIQTIEPLVSCENKYRYKFGLVENMFEFCQDSLKITRTLLSIREYDYDTFDFIED